MRFTRARLIAAFSLVALTSLIAHAQAPSGELKHFSKDGLVFDYPAAWTIEDQSDKDAQQLTLSRSDSEVQIKLYVHRGKVDTPEKMAQAKRAFIDPYIKSTSDMFVQMGATPQQTAATTEVGGAQAEGARLRATLSGEEGEADIYWLAVNNRVAVLTIFGPDKALKQAAPAWDAIRTSLHVEAAKPAEKAPPK